MAVNASQLPDIGGSGGGLTVNRQIIVATVVIVAGASLTRLASGAKLARIFVGAYILILILSLLDLFGGPVSKLAGALAMLAMVATLLAVLGDAIPLLRNWLARSGDVLSPAPEHG